MSYHDMRKTIDTVDKNWTIFDHTMKKKIEIFLKIPSRKQGDALQGKSPGIK